MAWIQYESTVFFEKSLYYVKLISYTDS